MRINHTPGICLLESQPQATWLARLRVRLSGRRAAPQHTVPCSSTGRFWPTHRSAFRDNVTRHRQAATRSAPPKGGIQPYSPSLFLIYGSLRCQGKSERARPPSCSLSIADAPGMGRKTGKAYRAQVMPNMQVASVARVVLLAKKVGLTSPQGLSPPDQSPISSIALPHYIHILRDDCIFD